MKITIITGNHTFDAWSRKAYISGPTSNMVNLNKPSFQRAEEYLEDMHLLPVNPHRLHPDTYHSDPFDPHWSDYMKKDLSEMFRCGIVCMIPGWDNSQGAIWEYLNAVRLNIPVIDITKCFHMHAAGAPKAQKIGAKISLKGTGAKYIFPDKNQIKQLSEKVIQNMLSTF